MKSIIRTVILFTGITLFSVSYGVEFPDEDRIKLAECLSKTLSWEEDDTKTLEDNLEKFCLQTVLEYSFILTKLKKIKKDSQTAYKEVEECLENDEGKLLDKYKKEVSNNILEVSPSLQPINKVVIGLCREKDLVKFDDLDNDEKGKPKAMQCFQDCAAKLFEKYESFFKFLKQNYLEKLQKGELNTSPEDQEYDQSEKIARTRSLQDITLEKSTNDFKEECKTNKLKDIATLTVIEEKYTMQYVKAVDEMYKANPIPKEKDKPFAYIKSYGTCIKWRCAMDMDEEQNYPNKELLNNILERKQEDPNDLFEDFE